MRIEIVTIGHEVLSGRTADTNFVHLARRLEEVDAFVERHTTVGDVAADIADALRAALSRAECVVVTGGLGPTPDDLTRGVVADTLGRPLETREEVLEHIRDRVRRAGRPMPASVEEMARVPRGATVWRNSVGSAPGVLIEHEGRFVVLLPGPPSELRAITDEHLLPWLRERSTQEVAVVTLHTFGIFESQLHARIAGLSDGWPEARLAYLPGPGGVDLRVTVSAPRGSGRAEATVTRARTELLARVGDWVHGEDDATMERVVGAALVERGWRLALAESCTGGLIAKRLTDVPGSSEWFERGFITYSNAAKTELLGVAPALLAAHGAVSEEVARAMAVGARGAAGVEVALAVTGIAGPGGGSEQKPVGTVCLAVASGSGDFVRRFQFPGGRTAVRDRSAQMALELLRRHLLGLPPEPPAA